MRPTRSSSATVASAWGDVWSSLYMLSRGAPARFAAVHFSKFGTLISSVFCSAHTPNFLPLVIYLHLFARKEVKSCYPAQKSPHSQTIRVTSCPPLTSFLGTRHLAGQ